MSIGLRRTVADDVWIGTGGGGPGGGGPGGGGPGGGGPGAQGVGAQGKRGQEVMGGGSRRVVKREEWGKIMPHCTKFGNRKKSA